MKIYATFKDDGFIERFDHLADGVTPPVGAVLVTPAQWTDLCENQTRRRWDGSAIVAFTPPPVVEVIRTTAVEFWRRTTEAEAATIEAGIEQLPVRKPARERRQGVQEHGRILRRTSRLPGSSFR